MTSHRIAVAVPGPFPFALTYVSDGPVAPGVRVEVPLQRRKVIGVVLDVPADDSLSADRLKPIERVLDEEPVLDETLLAFVQRLAAYYHAPLGEVMQLALPVALRQGKPMAVAGLPVWQLTEAGRQQAVEELPARAVRQRTLLAHLQAVGRADAGALKAIHDDWRSVLRNFEARGWVEALERPCLARTVPAAEQHGLTDVQQAVVEAVSTGQFGVHLLQGVTGSGKTAVYLALLERVLAAGRQALVLVPEIALTPQMVARFEQWLGEPVVALHSGLNDSERHCGWWMLASGQARVALGTRSALFSRFQNLGLIIVDEEHDPAYKQQEGVRYHARDMAIWRAQQLGIPVVLGSATPSLETLHHARTGRYQHLTLPERVGGGALPRIKLLDIRGERIEAGVSAPLRHAMARHLQAGHQVLLFLNRRGFAPVLMCHDCGWQADCPACDTHLTYHARPEHLHCHHCDYQRPVPPACPQCGSGNWLHVGQGTERLEAAMAEAFPEVPVVRIDRDTTRRKGALDEQLARVHAGEPMILLGTQMLAKGHDFANVSLVGLLEMDQGLFSPDFHAPERMAQLIVQVAGRAGRRAQASEILLQTHQPDHPLLRTLADGGYEAFAEAALQERQLAGLPPFSHQALLRVRSHHSEAAQVFLMQLRDAMQTWPQVADGSVALWGPVPSPMPRRQGYWRWQLLLQSESRKPLHAVLHRLVHGLWRQTPSAVQWSLDVDPVDLY